MTTTHHLPTHGATIAYDVRGDLPPAGGRPPLGRSTREDGRTDNDPAVQAEDVHAVIEALASGPVDLFASSGGAITALALASAHPCDVRTLVAHEPPLIKVLPDAEKAAAAYHAVQDTYAAKGGGAGMAHFIGMTTWQGEFTDDYLAQPAPDAAQFGMPTEDDGSRDDPLLSTVSNAVPYYRPDFEAVNAAATRVLIAVGVESQGTFTGRTSDATAAALGQEPTVFPSHHGGFLGGEFGQAGEPEAFAARLHEVLDAWQ
jgi:pimeloyl-ACP methyl ester carboxylesterase